MIFIQYNKGDVIKVMPHFDKCNIWLPMFIQWMIIITLFSSMLYIKQSFSIKEFSHVDQQLEQLVGFMYVLLFKQSINCTV